MRRLHWLCGAILCAILAAISSPGSAQDKTDPEPKKAVADPKKAEPDPKKTEPEPKKTEPEPKKTEPEPKKTEPEPKKSTPTVMGTVPRGFRMYLIHDGRFENTTTATSLVDEKRIPPTDDRIRIGKLHDPVTEYGLSTVIAVFARGVPADGSDPIVAVIKKQQELATKYRSQRIAAFTAFLALKKDFAADDDRDARMKEIAAIAKGAEVPLVSIGLAEATIARDDDAKDGAGKIAPQVAAWGIKAEDAITIVLYHRFKIEKRWAFPADRPPTEADLKDLSDAVDALMARLKN
jgi:hypothetical protein